MKCGRNAVIDADVGANSISESAGKLCAEVGDDIIWYAMLANNVFKNHFCQFRSVDVLLTGEVDRHPSQLVDNYHDPSVYRCCWRGQVS
jgi:hypothetical protein